MIWRVTALLWSLSAPAGAQPKRVLSVTRSAGFRRSTLSLPAQVLNPVARASGRLAVELTLDVRSVKLNLLDVHPGTEDLPLAWRHPFGKGLVFYTAPARVELEFGGVRSEAWLNPLP